MMKSNLNIHPTINSVNPNSANDNNKIEFLEPKNPLDPIVIFDPEYDVSHIILPYTNSDISENTTNGDEVNYLKVNGVIIPILKLNNKIIDPNKIYSLTITLKDFLPTINITIDDNNKNIQGTDVPGMNNIITVILTAPVNGANKKISMDFYITDCIFNQDNTVTYLGEFNCRGLKQVKYTQIGDSELSTYEMLEKISKELKLGFAASDKCKEISDKKWRQIYSETYKDYIQQELSYSGLDEDSVFDCWIDEFGYLVMVNLSHIMNEKIDPKQLSIKVITGEPNTLPNTSIPEQNVEEVYRIITNSTEIPGGHNLSIANYHSVVNNNAIINNGNLNRYYYLSSPCDENIIVQEQIQVIENSIDGTEGIEDYQYENIEFIGTNQYESEDGFSPIYQKKIISNFYNKLNAKTLEVVLTDANYSLQRGMLVEVIINEYDPVNKQFILNNMNNAIQTNKTEEDDEVPTETFDQRSLIIDENNGVMNPALSGIYYINGIELMYFAHTKRIQQTLILVKKGLQNNLTNMYTSVKLNNIES